MFTGMIESKGIINKIQPTTSGYRVMISPILPFKDIKLGDSIAVNGICLTATAVTDKYFTADISQETISRTNIKKLHADSYVNLERALKVGDRLGGHIVSGHIDGTGKIKDIRTQGESKIITFSLPKDLSRWTIEKGSIAIDGISLTIAECGNDFIKIALIPHSLSHTTLADAQVGDIINIECDMFAKYIYRYLHLTNTHSISTNEITLDTLIENGFF